MISYEELSKVFDMDNPLTLEYFELCSEDIKEQKYFDKHHILPKSIFAEHTNTKWNLVRVDYKTHYRLHEILPFIMVDDAAKLKMVQSWNILLRAREGECDKDTYASLRKLHKDLLIGESNPRYGTKLTEETKAKISLANKGRKVPDEVIEMHRKRLTGVPMKEEIKAKISAANKGKVKSEESKRKLSEAKKGHVRSEESKRKQSESSKGRKLTKEHIAKIVAKNTGRKRSPEICKKISDARKGKTLSQEAKLKIGMASKGRVTSEETKKKQSLSKLGVKISDKDNKANSLGQRVKCYRYGYRVKLDLELIDAIIRYYFKGGEKVINYPKT